jgi:hypothetical protein
MAHHALYLQAIWQQLQAGRADSVQWQQDAFWRSQLSGEYPVHPGWRCLARTPEIPGYFPGGDRGSGSSYTLGAEWNSDGTFVVNPDTNDAISHTISSTDTSTTYGSTLAVSNSGVVNYLNKFGDTISGNVGYKQYDPAAHLYYAALALPQLRQLLHLYQFAQLQYQLARRLPGHYRLG